MAVGALQKAFVEYQVHGLKNVDAIAYYEEQVVIVRADLDSLLILRGSTTSAIRNLMAGRRMTIKGTGILRT